MSFSRLIDWTLFSTSPRLGDMQVLIGQNGEPLGEYWSIQQRPQKVHARAIGLNTLMAP
jgi:hypothetical protein